MNLDELNKKSLSERDICTKFITPALVEAGWDVLLQVREEFTFTDGRIIVRGQMAARSKQRKRADYVLSYKSGIRLAVIEAKDNNHAVGAGMQQAIAYAEALDVPFVYSSNGDRSSNRLSVAARASMRSTANCSSPSWTLEEQRASSVTLTSTASRVRKRNYFGKYGEQARRVLEALLDKYADEGVEHIEGLEVLKVRPLDEFGSPLEIVKAFGGKQHYEEAVREMEAELYGAA